MLFRSDIHTLFDLGYVTVTPDAEFRVSGKLNDEWHNGLVYCALDRRKIALPEAPEFQPAKEFLEWHNDVVFRG